MKPVREVNNTRGSLEARAAQKITGNRYRDASLPLHARVGYAATAVARLPGEKQNKNKRACTHFLFNYRK